MKHRILQGVAAAAFAVLLSACADLPGGFSRGNPNPTEQAVAAPPLAARPAQPSRAPQGLPAGDLTMRLGTLPAQKMDAGSCGLFLWSRGDRRELLLFSGGGNAVNARVMFDGTIVTAPRTLADGASVLGQFERQTFQAGGLNIELTSTFERRPGLGRGALVPQGSMRLTQTDGWELVVPVVGLVGCQDS